MAKRVVAPDGRAWTVHRHWVPRIGTEAWTARFRRRFRRASRRGKDVADIAGDGCAVDIGDGLVGVLALLVIAAVAIFVVIPLVVAVVDLVVLLVLGGLGMAGRVLFRRPWVIEATDGQLRYRWRVVGWGPSRRRIAEIAGELSVGTRPSGELVPPETA